MSCNPLLTHVLFVQINKIILKSEQNAMINCLLEMSTAFSDASIHSFSSCIMQPGDEFLCHGNGTSDDILSICLAQKNRE
jgi:hypothetical protein